MIFTKKKLQNLFIFSYKKISEHNFYSIENNIYYITYLCNCEINVMFIYEETGYDIRKSLALLEDVEHWKLMEELNEIRRELGIVFTC